MVGEVLEVMGPAKGGIYCDATVGTAGHAAAILDASGRGGRLVGVDRDEQALELAAERLSSFDSSLWTLHHAPFSRLHDALDEAGVEACDGILADLGLSSLQIEDATRGFSFQKSGPLDMRMDRSQPGTVLDVLRGSSTVALEDILRSYGEERYAARVARRIRSASRAGRITDTLDLAREIREAVGRQRSGGVDAATRSFQALRIAVNHELDELSALLEDVVRLLRPGGVFVCLSYHSVEDRLVKRSFRECAARNEGEVLTRKPLTPERAEIHENRRARSAKLRAIRRTVAAGERS